MGYSTQGRSYFGMTGRQFGFLAVLALLTISVVIGGGYYVLTDSGLIGEQGDGLVANSPATPTLTSTSEPQPSPTLSPEEDEGNLLPSTWTPTPTLTEVPPDISDWTLRIEDLTDHFEVTTMVDLGLDSEPYLFEGEYPIIDLFSFIDSNDEFESVFGWTFLIEDEEDQVDFDDTIQEMELFTDQLVEDLSVEEVIDQEELEMPEGLGDSSKYTTVVAKIEDVYFRFDMILFRRDGAGVYCAIIYLDGEDPVIPLQDLALTLDTRIQGLE